MHFTHGFSIKPCPAGIMAVQGEERGERREEKGEREEKSVVRIGRCT